MQGFSPPLTPELHPYLLKSPDEDHKSLLLSTSKPTPLPFTVPPPNVPAYRDTNFLVVTKPDILCHLKPLLLCPIWATFP